MYLVLQYVSLYSTRCSVSPVISSVTLPADVRLFSLWDDDSCLHMSPAAYIPLKNQG